MQKRILFGTNAQSIPLVISKRDSGTSNEKIVLVLGLSLLGAVIVLRSLNQKREVLRFIEEEQANKNFDAFPPDIPEEEFEGLFV